MPATLPGSTLTNWLFAVGPSVAWLAQAPASSGGNVLAGNAIGVQPSGARASGNALGGGLFGASPGGAGASGNAMGGGLFGGSPGAAGPSGNALGGGLFGGSPGGAGSSGNGLGGGLFGGSPVGAGAAGNIIAGNLIGVGTNAGRGSISPILLSVDPDFMRAHLTWLNAWVTGSASPLNCVLIGCDFNRRPVDQLVFQRARVTRLTFSPLDAGLRTPWRLGVELTPGPVQWQKGGGSIHLPPQQRAWTSCNFELIIDGASMSKVDQIGLSAMSTPGVLPKVMLRIPSNDLQAFDAWLRSGRNAACAVNILTPSGSTLVALKFLARVSSINKGGGMSSGQLTMASVALSPTQPSLA